VGEYVFASLVPICEASAYQAVVHGRVVSSKLSRSTQSRHLRIARSEVARFPMGS